MKNILLVLISVLLMGCGSTGLKPNPILTSKEMSWYIPKGIEFQAKRTAEDELTTYKAEDDLMVLYMGKYLEVEKQANSCAR